MNYIDGLLDKSICKHCKHHVSRVLSSEGLDLYDEDGEPLDEELDELLHDACSLLHTELDHIVLQCSGYAPTDNASDYFFNNKDIWG